MYKCNVDAGWLAYFVNKLLRSLNQAARFPYNAVPPAGGLEGIVAPEISKPMTWWHGLLQSTVRLWTVCLEVLLFNQIKIHRIFARSAQLTLSRFQGQFRRRRWSGQGGARPLNILHKWIVAIPNQFTVVYPDFYLHSKANQWCQKMGPGQAAQFAGEKVPQTLANNQNQQEWLSETVSAVHYLFFSICI